MCPQIMARLYGPHPATWPRLFTRSGLHLLCLADLGTSSANRWSDSRGVELSNTGHRPDRVYNTRLTLTSYSNIFTTKEFTTNQKYQPQKIDQSENCGHEMSFSLASSGNNCQYRWHEPEDEVRPPGGLMCFEHLLRTYDMRKTYSKRVSHPFLLPSALRFIVLLLSAKK